MASRRCNSGCSSLSTAISGVRYYAVMAITAASLLLVATGASGASVSGTRALHRPTRYTPQFQGIRDSTTPNRTSTAVVLGKRVGQAGVQVGAVIGKGKAQDPVVTGPAGGAQTGVREAIRTNATPSVTPALAVTRPPLVHRDKSWWKSHETCELRRKSFTIESEGCVSQDVELGWCKGLCYNRDWFETRGTYTTWTTRLRCCRVRTKEIVTVHLSCDGGQRTHDVALASASSCKCTSRERT